MDQSRVLVLVLRVNSFGECNQGYLTDFDMSIESIEAFLGGTIVLRNMTDNLVMLFNAEGTGYSNRYFCGVFGEPSEVINGNILCSKVVDSEFTDISREEANLLIHRLKPVNELVSTLQIVTEEDVYMEDI